MFKETIIFQINEYLEKISKQFKDVKVFKIGNSYENREMKGVKISSGRSRKKPAILIDAGIHAREWIAPTTALFAISQLLKENNKYLYKNVDWYIIPTLNPDGYEFSHVEVSLVIFYKNIYILCQY